LSNIRSLKNKFEELSAVVLNSNSDINIFTETWLQPDTPDNAIKIFNYNLIRFDRLNSKGGGIIIYVKNEFHDYHVHQFVVPHTESLFIDFKKLKIFLVSIYHPHWSCPSKHIDAVDGLINILSQFYHKYSNYSFIVCGDFNGMADHYRPISESFGLINIINFTTRANKTLDYFLTNMSYTATKQSPIGKSDHCCIEIKPLIKKHSNVVRVIKKPDFSPKNQILFNDIMSHFNNLIFSNNVDNDWNYFIQIVKQVFDLCFPLRTIRIYDNPKCPWINDNIRMIIRKRDIAYRKNLKSSYKHWKNKVKVELKKSKETYFKNINKLQTKGQWCKVKDYLNLTSYKQNTQFSDDDLNNYFSSVYISDNLIIPASSSINQNNVKHISVEESEVFDILQKVKKNGGCPFIYSKMLRKFAHCFSKPLTYLINSSIEKSIFPDILKQSVITPVPKIPNPTSTSDFRPITAASPFSKIIEKVIQTQLLEPIIFENRKMFQDQFAFIPFYYTQN